MKDIRPILDKVEKALKSKSSARNISEQVMEMQKSIPTGSLLYNELSFIGCWDEGAYMDCECEHCLESFEETRKDCLSLIKTMRGLDWPDSRDALVASYSKPSGGFGLKISVQVSGLEVFCIHQDLKKEVEQALTKLNQSQSAQNFLLNAVYILPEKYKEYKLEM
jgi:hypothetical protein